MDGTLVDTEPYWIEAESELVAAYGGTWTQADAMRLVGSDLLDSARYIRDRADVPMEPPAIVEALLDGVIARLEEQVPWRPGAVELLASLREAGVPCGLVTMSYHRFAAPLLDRLPDGAFSVVVTGDLVARGKPHPEPYLSAAAALGVRPEHCLAIQDSDTGARSAEAAGCTVVVVENHVTVHPGERRIFLDSLVGLRPADLPALLPPAS
jgi:HAD superfamily hydrolase (TIGR01509 family)